jgi:O-antigen/teichoic acid export membrane protein
MSAGSSSPPELDSPKSLLSRIGLGGRLGREIARAAIGSTGVRLIGTAMAFGVGVQLARYLGPEQYGLYGTIMALVALLSVPCQFGFTQLVVRELAVHSSRIDLPAFKGTLVGLSAGVVIASLLTLIIAFPALHWMPSWSAEHDAYAWLLLIVPIYALISFGSGVLRGMGNVVLASSFDALLRPGLFAGALFLVMHFTGAMSAARALGLNMMTAAVALILLLLVVLRYMPLRLGSHVGVYKPRTWLGASLPMFATELLRTLDAQVGIMLISFNALPAETGYFRVAAATALFFGLPITVINLIIAPYIARFHALAEKRRLQRLMAGAAIASIVGTGGLIAILLAAGTPLVVAVFGPEYSDAWVPMIILALAHFATALFGANQALLNMTNEEGSVTFGFLLGLAFTTVLSLLLVDRYGASGVAIGMLAGSVSRGLFMSWRSTATLGLQPGLLGVFTLLRSARLPR